MWTLYLLVSAGGFRARYLQLWQVVFSRDGTPAAYRLAGIRQVATAHQSLRACDCEDEQRDVVVPRREGEDRLERRR